ncbi:MAG TPA: HAD-IB family phosphatase [Chitinophagaceae bacterium]|nr:HAD-IB family phosphatase [Chitinophagaceae bacterium]
MISVIIPVLNEEKTIAKVVRFCFSNKLVNEVIVVDDNSEDSTAQIAAAEGAKVIASNIRGKGISMKEGVAAASNELLVFLDGDIDPYPDETISALTRPLISHTADFVKGTFGRNAGRVTELVAKPLLNIFFPALAQFSQPLSGMIAGKKSFFAGIAFFNDYGVDVGILIDMYLMKAKITEVNIGYIENKSKPWEALGKMSKEVARAIITKGQQQSPADAQEAEVKLLEEINREMYGVLRENFSFSNKMAIFDMDDTILCGRFIDACATQFGFSAKLEDLRAEENDAIILTKRIGLLLKGRTMDELLNVVHDMDMVEDIKDTVAALKQRGYLTGIISNSYSLITNYVAKNIGADFSYAKQLEFFEGKCTGEVFTPSYFYASPESICGHAYCKTNALQYVCEKYNVQFKNCIVVGDSEEDRCIIGNAGKGFAFCSKDEILKTIAYKKISQPGFKGILEYA